MVSSRVRNSKPNHAGSYSQQRRYQKVRNHTHQFFKTKNTKQEEIILCKTAQCKYIEVNRGI